MVGSFKYSLGDCQLRDECALLHDCHAQASCTDTQDSYTCECNSSMRWSNMHRCELRHHTLYADATCENTAGDYTCTCNSGFSGNGASCTNINDCDQSWTCNCHANATCTDTSQIITMRCHHLIVLHMAIQVQRVNTVKAMASRHVRRSISRTIRWMAGTDIKHMRS